MPRRRSSNPIKCDSGMQSESGSVNRDLTPVTSVNNNHGQHYIDQLSAEIMTGEEEGRVGHDSQLEHYAAAETTKTSQT